MLNIAQIEENVKKFSKKIDPKEFAYELLISYGIPKATVTRAKKGNKNLAKNDHEVVIKKKLFYAFFDSGAEEEFAKLVEDSKTFSNDPRFVITVDKKHLFALDTKLGEKIDFPLKEFPKKFDFFLPFAGIEKKEFQHENPVDVKAAEKLAKLFDLIKKDNPKSDEKSLHSLNVFLTRLLFCYFAEDTDIFPSGIFTKSIGSHTQNDGSDLSEYLHKLFQIMNQEKRPKNTPDYLNQFPYVNGGLFAEEHSVPSFSKKSREALIDVGDLNWAEINPDIFGSMIQAVVHPEQRAGLGMHYTSVSNIMKVIKPLFLDDLYKEYEVNRKNDKKLHKLLRKLAQIKIFDPACGSGNFLIIAYKELRSLEMKILRDMPNEMKFSYIPLSNFYGIELDDFAHEVATLSLWLAEHQMDVKFKEEFGEVKASLPLKDGGNIVCANATRIDWEDVCSSESDEPIYILGNPPYLGATLQSKLQKEDVVVACDNYKGCKLLDYIGAWFYKASKYIESNKNTKCGFVSTNSITQGSLVGILWPELFKFGVEICFAHKSFVWKNNAKDNAGVICVIIGLSHKSKKSNKKIIGDGYEKDVKSLNPYLIEGANIVVTQSSKPLNGLKGMFKGSAEHGDGHLVLTKTEKEIFISENPASKRYILKYMSSSDFIRGVERYCIWITDVELKNAKKIPLINERIEKVREYRENSSGRDTKKTAHIPHKFTYARHNGKEAIIVPRVSSERRKYIPVGFVRGDTVISDAAQAIFDADLLTFSILNTRLHNVWVQATGGRLKNDYRYSSALSYNTFPLPVFTEESRSKLEQLGMSIISAREKYPEKTYSDLYDPDSMPDDLQEAHENLDLYFEQLYKKNTIKDDTDRLKILLDEYQKMVMENE